MRDRDDDQGVHDDLDDRLLGGTPVTGDPGMTAFVAALRATGQVPVPVPRADLAAVLRDGLPAQDGAAGSAGRRRVVVPLDLPGRRAVRYVAGLGLAAKLTLGAGVAAASVTGAATIDAVPDVVQEPASALVSGVVDLVTPGPADRPRAPDEDPTDQVPTTQAPEDETVDEPTTPPSPRGTDAPGRTGDEPGSDTGLDRELPDQADDAAEEARERAREAEERRQEAKERAERAREQAENRQGSPQEPTPPRPPSQGTGDSRPDAPSQQGPGSDGGERKGSRG